MTTHCPVDEAEVERCARAAWASSPQRWPWAEIGWDRRREMMRETRAVLSTYLEARTVIENDRLARLVAASAKLRRFVRSIVGYGGSVPEAEALTDGDLVL